MRELCKWDYELRNGEQLEAVIDRAIEIATSEPCGPVYLIAAARGDDARR